MCYTKSSGVVCMQRSAQMVRLLTIYHGDSMRAEVEHVTYCWFVTEGAVA